MTRRKSILGALIVCALSVCAFGAANASAAGYTAYTCEEGTKGAETYIDSHCTEDDAANKSNFKTKPIPLNTTTAVTSTQATTGVTTGANEVSKLKGKIALATVTIECKTMMSEEAWTENKTSGETMSNIGGGKLHYTECSVAGFPKCTVNSPEAAAGTIVTNKLKTESVAGGVKFQPAEGETFVTLVISGAECVPKGTFPVKGSVTGAVPAAKHSHLTFNEATGLTMGVAAATYTGTYHTVMEGATNTIGLQEGA